MTLDNVSREDWTVGALALLLAISLLFFPWYHVSASFGPISISRDDSATSSPYAIWGVLALITSLAVLADVAVQRLSPQTEIPTIGGSRAATRLAIVGATVVLLVIKFLAHIGDFGWGFYLSVVVLAGLGYVAYVQRDATTVMPPAAAAAPPPPPPAPPAEPTSTGSAGGSAPPPGP
jgi:hypothetical protein